MHPNHVHMPYKCPSQDFGDIPFMRKFYSFMDSCCAGDNPATSVICSHIEVFHRHARRLGTRTAQAYTILTSTQSEVVGLAVLLHAVVNRRRFPWLGPPSLDLKLLHCGGDNKRFVAFWPRLLKGEEGPPHMKNILKYIRDQVLALQDLQWVVYFFYYPRTHPSMLTVDNVARHTAYQISKDLVTITRHNFFPHRIWQAIKLDSAAWVELRRTNPNEPEF